MSLTMHAARLMLYEIDTKDIDFLIFALTEWEHAFKTRQDWTMEQAIALTECPKHLESALVDTINAHRFYLTQRKKCLCMACDGQRLKILLASLPPLDRDDFTPHHDYEIGGES
jgi:hypothetical protein